MSSTILCCDLGGSSLRVGLVDGQGDLLAQASSAISVTVGPDGRSEVDPSLWWHAFRNLVAALGRDHPSLFGAVAGLAICGMTRTQVLVDEGGASVRPAITWMDSRAVAEAEELAGSAGEGVDAYHPAARLAWVARHEPAAFSRARTVLEPKDFLALRLTGRPASDRVSLARLLAATRQSEALAPFHSLLPDLLTPCSLVGHVTAGLASPLDMLAGRPVFMTSHDTWTAVVGLGALRAGMAYDIIGTSEVLGLMAQRPVTAEGLMAVEWGADLHQIGGPSQNGADVIPWLMRICGADERHVAEMLAHLLAAERHPQPLLFLPFLKGERVPYWDADLRGSFLGLSGGHGPADLAWAVLEGAAFASRVVLERAETAAGGPAREIRLGGGGSRNDAWSRIRADILGRPVVVGACEEPGLLGCAAVAWTGLGRFGSLAEAQEVLARPSKRFSPRPGVAHAYDALFGAYKEAVSAVTPVAHRLAAMRNAVGLAQARES